MSRTRAVLNPLLLKRKRNSFTFSYIAPLPPIQCWRVTQQFPTKTIPFCTTLNGGGGGGGERSNEDIKSADVPNGFVYDRMRIGKSALNAYNSRSI